MIARAVAGRVAGMVVVLVVVSIATFAAFDLLPRGDPAERLAGRQPSTEQVRAIRHEWGFDRSIPAQYLTMMRKAFFGRLVSYQTGVEVHGEIWRRLPRTLWLALGGMLLAAGGGIGLALFAAGRRRRAAGAVADGLAVAGISLPVFWLGAVLAYLVGFRLGVLPDGGYVPFFGDPLEWLSHLVLPWITVAVVASGTYVLVARTRIEQALAEEYTRAARAAGIGRRALVRRALRPALGPLVALWGLDFAGIVAGSAVLVESVFDLGGVGQYAADSMSTLDAPAVIGVTLLAAFFIVIVNALADVAQVALEPRRRQPGPP
jgi:peptide/nickel transport system permease protein